MMSDSKGAVSGGCACVGGWSRQRYSAMAGVRIGARCAGLSAFGLRYEVLRCRRLPWFRPRNGRMRPVETPTERCRCRGFHLGAFCVRTRRLGLRPRCCMWPSADICPGVGSVDRLAGRYLVPDGALYLSIHPLQARHGERVEGRPCVARFTDMNWAEIPGTALGWTDAGVFGGPDILGERDSRPGRAVHGGVGVNAVV